MAYRTDKFAPGDKVVWADDHYATLTDGREKYGDGPFVIGKVFDRPYVSDPYDPELGSNWDSMGHTQHVSILGAYSHISGAYFKKLD